MKKQNKTIKVKRYKKTSLIFPIVGGALLVGGAATGIAIGLTKSQRVSTNTGTIEMDPYQTTGKITFKFNKQPKDGQTFAKITGFNSNSNDTAETQVVFTGGEHSTEGTFPVVDKEAEVEFELINPPAAKGEYTYTFGITFSYFVGDNEKVETKVENLRINYTVTDDWIMITDPTDMGVNIPLDKNGDGQGQIKGFTYNGSVAGPETIRVEWEPDVFEPNIEVRTSIVNLDTDKCSFGVNLTVRHGFGTDEDISRELNGTLVFYYNGREAHRTSLLDKGCYIKENLYVVDPAESLTAAATPIPNEDRSWDWHIEFGTEGHEDQRFYFGGIEKDYIDQIKITPNFEDSDEIRIEPSIREIEYWDEGEGIEYNKHRWFALDLDVHVNDVFQLLHHHFEGTFTFKVPSSTGEIEYTTTQICSLNIMEEDAIFAPNTFPEFVKVRLDEGSSLASGTIKWSGWTFAGLNNSPLSGDIYNVDVATTIEVPGEEYAFTVTPYIPEDTISKSWESFEIWIDFEGVNLMNWWGETIWLTSVTATGHPVVPSNEDVNVPIYNLPDGMRAPIQFQYFDKIIPPSASTFTFTANQYGIVDCVLPGFGFTGFEGDGQRENLMITPTIETEDDIKIEWIKAINWEDPDLLEPGSVAMQMQVRIEDPTQPVSFKITGFKFEYPGSEIAYEQTQNITVNIEACASITDPAVTTASAQIERATNGHDIAELTITGFQASGFKSTDTLAVKSSWSDMPSATISAEAVNWSSDLTSFNVKITVDLGDYRQAEASGAAYETYVARGNLYFTKNDEKTPMHVSKQCTLTINPADGVSELNNQHAINGKTEDGKAVVKFEKAFKYTGDVDPTKITINALEATDAQGQERELDADQPYLFVKNTESPDTYLDLHFFLETNSDSPFIDEDLTFSWTNFSITVGTETKQLIDKQFSYTAHVAAYGDIGDIEDDAGRNITINKTRTASTSNPYEIEFSGFKYSGFTYEAAKNTLKVFADGATSPLAATFTFGDTLSFKYNDTNENHYQWDTTSWSPTFKFVWGPSGQYSYQTTKTYSVTLKALATIDEPASESHQVIQGVEYNSGSTSATATFSGFKLNYALQAGDTLYAVKGDGWDGVDNVIFGNISVDAQGNFSLPTTISNTTPLTKGTYSGQVMFYIKNGTSIDKFVGASKNTYGINYGVGITDTATDKTGQSVETTASTSASVNVTFHDFDYHSMSAADWNSLTVSAVGFAQGITATYVSRSLDPVTDTDGTMDLTVKFSGINIGAGQTVTLGNGTTSGLDISWGTGTSKKTLHSVGYQVTVTAPAAGEIIVPTNPIETTGTETASGMTATLTGFSYSHVQSDKVIDMVSIATGAVGGTVTISRVALTPTTDDSGTFDIIVDITDLTAAAVTFRVVAEGPTGQTGVNCTVNQPTHAATIDDSQIQIAESFNFDDGDQTWSVSITNFKCVNFTDPKANLALVGESFSQQGLSAHNFEITNTAGNTFSLSFDVSGNPTKDYKLTSNLTFQYNEEQTISCDGPTAAGFVVNLAAIGTVSDVDDDSKEPQEVSLTREGAGPFTATHTIEGFDFDGTALIDSNHLVASVDVIGSVNVTADAVVTYDDVDDTGKVTITFTGLSTMEDVEMKSVRITIQYGISGGSAYDLVVSDGWIFTFTPQS